MGSNGKATAFVDYLVENSFQDKLKKMEDDSLKAIKQWKQQQDALDDFPSDYLKDYKKDGSDLQDAEDAFYEVWRKMYNDGQGDPKKLDSAFQDYLDALKLLQQGNARFQALLDLNV